MKRVFLATIAFCILSFGFLTTAFGEVQSPEAHNALLTDPFLQKPTEDSVNVVWFTEFKGQKHWVACGSDMDIEVEASTFQLSHAREDQKSRLGEEPGSIYKKTTDRAIWRHEAVVTDIKEGQKIPYQVKSINDDGQTISSGIFVLSAMPSANTPINILFTSDHQSKNMTPANLEKLIETVGNIDVVFHAGDLINVPDRASEWFDDTKGIAFFPCYQGKASKELSGKVYTGAQILQNAPIYTVIGNHEVIGETTYTEQGINHDFNAVVPRYAAEEKYNEVKDSVNPSNDPEIKAEWIEDHSFNTKMYEEIFTLPESEVGGEKYYAETIGDVRLVSLYITRIWRGGSLSRKSNGKYVEAVQNYDNPEDWGYGTFIFEPIKEGSEQYNWLVSELNSEAFKNAKYKIIMFHHTFHSLGGNNIPAFTDPVQKITKNGEGNITDIQYVYPMEDDYLINDLEPLLEDANVDLVLFGHSHLWNRFVGETGINFIETSNVGNSYGAFIGDKKRGVPGEDIFNPADYIAAGDPYGLKPVMPNVQPLNKGEPFISSNKVTVFTVFNTGTGNINSYYFDTERPDSEVVLFDTFSIK